MQLLLHFAYVPTFEMQRSGRKKLERTVVQNGDEVPLLPFYAFAFIRICVHTASFGENGEGK